MILITLLILAGWATALTLLIAAAAAWVHLHRRHANRHRTPAQIIQFPPPRGHDDNGRKSA